MSPIKAKEEENKSDNVDKVQIKKRELNRQYQMSSSRVIEGT